MRYDSIINKTQGNPYDCNCCKSFITRIGNLVKVEGGKVVDTIWNVEVEGYFQDVADALHAYVMECPVTSKFLINEKKIGKLSNPDNQNAQIIWQHFEISVPDGVFTNNAGQIRGEFDTTAQVFKTALDNISPAAADLVLSLIDDSENPLYRGREYRHFVEFFLQHKDRYDALADTKAKWLYVLEQTSRNESVKCRLKNTAIGTLLVDLSEIDLGNHDELLRAVNAYGTKVDPLNYRRTSSVVSPKMIQEAQAAIEKMGYMDSLNRRVMQTSEIPADNLIWRGEVAKPLDTFQAISQDQQEKLLLKKQKGGAKKIKLAEFLDKVLPDAKGLAIMFDPALQSHLFTMTTAVNPESKKMFKWDNHAAWSYKGDVTDRIKERVKEAGGKVEGDVRVSLSWSNSDDLDLHCEKGSEHLYWNKKKGIDGMFLDLDMNGMDEHDPVAPVENIIVPDKSRLSKGNFKFRVHQYNKRNAHSDGFTVQVEFGGIIRNFTYGAGLNNQSSFDCFTIVFDGENFAIEDINPQFTSTHDVLSSEVWGIETNRFAHVSHIMTSPNYWDDNRTGNKHFMFVVDKCYNNEPVRTLFSEYLNEALQPHRRTFELLGNSLKAEPVVDQVSGFGFSETVQAEFTVRVTDKRNQTTLYQIGV